MVSVRWKRYLALASVVLFLSPMVPSDELLSKLENGTARRNHTVLSSGATRYLKEAMPEYRPVSSADYDAFWFDPASLTNAFDASWFN